MSGEVVVLGDRDGNGGRGERLERRLIRRAGGSSVTTCRGGDANEAVTSWAAFVTRFCWARSSASMISASAGDAVWMTTD